MTDEKSEARELPENDARLSPAMRLWHALDRRLQLEESGKYRIGVAYDPEVRIIESHLHRLAPADAASGVLGEKGECKCWGGSGFDEDHNVIHDDDCPERKPYTAQDVAVDPSRVRARSRSTGLPTPEQPAAEAAGEEWLADLGPLAATQPPMLVPVKSTALARLLQAARERDELRRAVRGLTDNSIALYAAATQLWEGLAECQHQLETVIREHDHRLEVMFKPLESIQNRILGIEEDERKSLRTQLAAANATIARVQALVPKWDGEQANYEVEAEGTDTDAETAAYAAACLRCCMRELSAALAPATPGDSG